MGLSHLEDLIALLWVVCNSILDHGFELARLGVRFVPQELEVRVQVIHLQYSSSTGGMWIRQQYSVWSAACMLYARAKLTRGLGSLSHVAARLARQPCAKRATSHAGVGLRETACGIVATCDISHRHKVGNPYVRPLPKQQKHKQQQPKQHLPPNQSKQAQPSPNSPSPSSGWASHSGTSGAPHSGTTPHEPPACAGS